MHRSLPALLLVLTLIIGASFGDQPSEAVPDQRNHDSSTLRLYFAPDLANAQRGQPEFKPLVARVLVDDVFVGNAIINGLLPTLRFGAGAHTIRVELGDRKFESKVTFLGRDSTQILFVNLDTATAVATE